VNFTFELYHIYFIWRSLSSRHFDGTELVFDFLTWANVVEAVTHCHGGIT
jgi:hypothetical protein